MAVSEPRLDISIIPASQILEVGDHRTIIFGQQISGSSTPKVLIQDFPNDKSEDALFGRRSFLAGMIRAFKQENRNSPLDVIPLEITTGTESTSTITFSGTAAEDGVLNVFAGSKKKHKFELVIEKDETAATIATNLETLINLDLDTPFTVGAVGGVITFTAASLGPAPNDWPIGVEGAIPNLSVTITAWTGGTGTPDLTDIFDQISNIRYQTVVWPSSLDITLIKDDLDEKFNTSNNILDGVAIQTNTDTLANLRSYVLLINSQSVVVPGQQKIDNAARKGPSSMEMLDIISSQVAAVRALRLTTGVNLTRYLTTNAPKDQFGGSHLASLPYFNTALPNMPVAKQFDEFDTDELLELSNNGVANLGPNRNFSRTVFGTFVTTYLTDKAANPDISYKFLNTVDTASIIREFYFINCRNRYAQSRLTDGDLIAGYDMANAGSIRAFCKRLYDELATVALVAAGIEGKRDFDNNLIITTNLASGTASLIMSPLLVTQLRVLLGTIQINFGEGLT